MAGPSPITLYDYLQRLAAQRYGGITAVLNPLLGDDTSVRHAVADFEEFVTGAAREFDFSDAIHPLLYDTEQPIHLRALLLVVCMEVTPWLLYGIPPYKPSWEYCLMDKIDFARLEPPLQELARQLMLAWPEESLDLRRSGNRSTLTDEYCQHHGYERTTPLLWAVRSVGWSPEASVQRVEYLDRIPVFISELRLPDSNLRGYAEVLSETNLPVSEKIHFDTHCLSAARDRVRADPEKDSEQVFLRAYLCAVVRFYGTATEEVVVAMFGNEQWRGQMLKQFKAAEEVSWGRYDLHDPFPKYGFACLGRLYRLDGPKGIARTLSLLGYFSGMLREAVYTACTMKEPEQRAMFVDFESADARHGMQAALKDRSAKLMPESHLLLQQFITSLEPIEPQSPTA